MILGFTKTITVEGKRKKTYFEEKILDGIKIHTIREDQHRRWKPGTRIHFATGVRTSRYNCFLTDTCKSTQEITLQSRTIRVDGRLLSTEEATQLARNDGFFPPSDFWEWFKDYPDGTKLELIHWTDFKY